MCARAVECSLLPECCRLESKAMPLSAKWLSSLDVITCSPESLNFWSCGSDRCGLMILVRTRGGLKPPIIWKCDEGTRGKRRVSDNERLNVIFHYSSEYVPCHVPYQLQFVLQCEHCARGPELRAVGGVRDFWLLQPKVEMYRILAVNIM